MIDGSPDIAMHPLRGLSVLIGFLRFVVVVRSRVRPFSAMCMTAASATGSPTDDPFGCHGLAHFRFRGRVDLFNIVE